MRFHMKELMIKVAKATPEDPKTPENTQEDWTTNPNYCEIKNPSSDECPSPDPKAPISLLREQLRQALS